MLHVCKVYFLLLSLYFHLADVTFIIFLEAQQLYILGIEMFEDEDSDDNESIQWEQEPETLGKGIFKYTQSYEEKNYLILPTFFKIGTYEIIKILGYGFI